ncbi:MAG: hypothetical protein ACTJG2_00335 [Candidatus Saccharimonadales bacterium]
MKQQTYYNQPPVSDPYNSIPRTYGTPPTLEAKDAFEAVRNDNINIVDDLYRVWQSEGIAHEEQLEKLAYIISHSEPLEDTYDRFAARLHELHQYEISNNLGKAALEQAEDEDDLLTAVSSGETHYLDPNSAEYQEFLRLWEEQEQSK